MTNQRKPLKDTNGRQKKAAKLISENVSADKPKAVGEILREAGYSESTAKRPSQVTRSDSFMALMESMGVTDDKLINVMKEGLAASNYVKTEKVTGVGKTRVKTEEVVAVPDLNVRHKYMETGLRLKGLGRIQGEQSINFYQLAGEVKNEFSNAA